MHRVDVIIDMESDYLLDDNDKPKNKKDNSKMNKTSRLKLLIRKRGLNMPETYYPFFTNAYPENLPTLVRVNLQKCALIT